MDTSLEPISYKVFQNNAELESKQIGKEKLKEDYPNLHFKEPVIQFVKMDIDDLHCYTAHYIYKAQAKEDDAFYSVPIVLQEKHLPDGRYNAMSIAYIYTLYNLDTKTSYKNIIGKLGRQGKSKGFQKVYFALKYYFEVLKKPIKDIDGDDTKADLKALSTCCYQACNYYIFGSEWDSFFEYLINFLKIKKQNQKEQIASQVYSFYKEYKYSLQDIKIALEYFYGYLEKPIPDVPTLGIVPHVMNDAKQKAQEEIDKKELMDYIIKLFNLDPNENYPLIQAEIRRFRSKEYGNMTYKGMKTTLDYCYNLLKKDLPKHPSISIIPYKYDEALKFYTQRLAVKETGGLPNKVPVIQVYVDVEARKRNQQLYEGRYINKKNLQSIAEIEVDENEIFDRI